MGFIMSFKQLVADVFSLSTVNVQVKHVASYADLALIFNRDVVLSCFMWKYNLLSTSRLLILFSSCIKT